MFLKRAANRGELAAFFTLSFGGVAQPRPEQTLSGVYSKFETARFIGTLPPKRPGSKIIPNRCAIGGQLN